MKGFTLIELLAVIVILAVIALIATPIVLGIINDTKESAVIRSAEFYVDAVKNGIMKKNLELNGTLNPEVCEVIDKYKVKCDEALIDIEVDGDVPDSGTITFNRGKATNVELVFGERKVVTNENGELVLEDIDKLAPGLYDENDNLIYTWDELLNITTTYESWNSEISDYELVTAPILKVDENGVLTSVFDADMWNNYSAEYLDGKLVIDKGVTSIGSYAFEGTYNLKTIILPSSLRNIGSYAFDASSLESITILEGITTVGENAFAQTYNLKTITLPNSLTTIGHGAFQQSGLESINIPEGVTTIGEYAFCECSYITSITLPSSLESIGFWAIHNSNVPITYNGYKSDWNKISLEDGNDFYNGVGTINCLDGPFIPPSD